MTKKKQENNFTIYIRKEDNLVELDSLPEQEKNRIQLDFFIKLADGLMEPQGYHRVGKGVKT